MKECCIFILLDGAWIAFRFVFFWLFSNWAFVFRAKYLHRQLILFNYVVPKWHWQNNWKSIWKKNTNDWIMWKSNEGDFIFDEFDYLYKRFVDVINDEISQTQGKEEQYFSNPINAYLFIKHLTIEWYRIKTMIPPGIFIQSISISWLISFDVYLDLSKIMGENWLFPSLEDHTGKSSPSGRRFLDPNLNPDLNPDSDSDPDPHL